ncbi:unnamed protein product [Rhizophagus irregularis]|nr:unnamed protein product [Rhizophagus irregularis]CAB5374273.1 unnamed protein product [Rhizophagus irregularis]
MEQNCIQAFIKISDKEALDTNEKELPGLRNGRLRREGTSWTSKWTLETRRTSKWTLETRRTSKWTLETRRNAS